MMLRLYSASERSVLTRRLLSGLCAGAFAFQIGCYSFLPVQSELPVKADRISLTINDRGRVLLADRVAPLLDRIEGRLINADSANVTIAVSRVVNLRKDVSNWTGERVIVPREAILGFQDRPYSRSRTFALIGALIGGLVLLALSISLAVSGSGLPDPTSGGGTSDR